MAGGPPSEEGVFDPDKFWVFGSVYLIAPFPRPTDPRTLAASIVRVSSVSKDGQIRKAVVAFTDLALAERFVEELGDRGKKQKPLTFRNKYDFADAIGALTALGDTHIAFDPEPTRVVRIPITDVVTAIGPRPG